MVAVRLGSSAEIEKWKIIKCPRCCAPLLATGPKDASRCRPIHITANRGMPRASLDEIRSRVGEEVGVSDWIAVDQARILAFAEATEDRQFIHVDAETAART